MVSWSASFAESVTSFCDVAINLRYPPRREVVSLENMSKYGMSGLVENAE